MNLRNKTLLAVGITFAGFFLFMAALTLPVSISGLDHLEQQDSRDSALQIKAVIGSDMESLQNTAHDWSWWDEMDQYARDRNPAFESGNLNRESMANLKAGLFVVTDTNGTVLSGRLLTPDFRTEIPISAVTLAGILNNPSMTNISGPETGITGIVVLPEGPMILASSPILPSSREGSPHGMFIIGRYLESGALSRVHAMTGNPVHIVTEGETARVSTDQSVLTTRYPDSTVYIIPHNETTITGVISLVDLNGKTLLITTDLPRDVYHAGFAIIDQFFILFALSAIVVAIVVALVLDRTVLEPLARLSRRIEEYEIDPERLNEPVLKTNDELAGLEKTIIQASRNLADSEKRFRYIVETAQEGILVIDENLTIIFANERLTSMIGYRPGEIFGLRVTQFIPESERAYHDRLQSASSPEENRQYECSLVRRDGSILWAIISTTPIHEDGKRAGFFIMVTDISDRRQTEVALRQASNKLSLLSSVTCNDIMNKTFTLTGYAELAKAEVPPDSSLGRNLDKQLSLIRLIIQSLDFAKNYQGLGAQPPRWQNVRHTFLFGVSHLDLMHISRKMELGGLEIFADPLLEKVFFSLAENVLRHSKTATTISLTYEEAPDGLVLVFEDNGIGIADACKETIFERRTDQKQGMGLFLAREILAITSIGIVETGREGKGARFEIHVPRGGYRFSG